MRALLVALCLLLTTPAVHADGRLTKTGKALAAIGVVHTALGVVFGVLALVGPKGYDDMQRVLFEAMSGTMAGSGAVLVAVGTPMWVVGDKRDHQVGVTLGASGLTVRF